mmetsp:Transcript_36543/g.103204  ORF Transcript_36543/g.103204 Transcript_36543/m.103204 type:complete len:402 (+) Transcript_36543:64-1269(+)
MSMRMLALYSYRMPAFHQAMPATAPKKLASRRRRCAPLVRLSRLRLELQDAGVGEAEVPKLVRRLFLHIRKDLVKWPEGEPEPQGLAPFRNNGVGALGGHRKRQPDARLRIAFGLDEHRLCKDLDTEGGGIYRRASRRDSDQYFYGLRRRPEAGHLVHEAGAAGGARPRVCKPLGRNGDRGASWGGCWLLQLLLDLRWRPGNGGRDGLGHQREDGFIGCVVRDLLHEVLLVHTDAHTRHLLAFVLHPRQLVLGVQHSLVLVLDPSHGELDDKVLQLAVAFAGGCADLVVEHAVKDAARLALAVHVHTWLPEGNGTSQGRLPGFVDVVPLIQCLLYGLGDLPVLPLGAGRGHFAGAADVNENLPAAAVCRLYHKPWLRNDVLPLGQLVCDSGLTLLLPDGLH